MVENARTRVSDYVWAGVSLVAAVGVVRLVIGGVRGLLADPTLGGFGIFVVGTVLIVGVGRWIVVGAWRRTVWGAPEGGVRDHRERRIEARHGQS
jgi:hypothetical protein